MLSVNAREHSILEAARSAVATFGLQRFKLDDVAQLAGVTRQTVYRYFGSKRRLMSTLLTWECERLFGRLQVEFRKAPTLRRAVETTILLALREQDRHPIFQRLLETEPEVFLAFLASDSGPALSAARNLLRELILGYRPHLAGAVLDRATDAIVRLTLSYGVSPAADNLEMIAATLAELFCFGLLKDPAATRNHE